MVLRDKASVNDPFQKKKEGIFNPPFSICKLAVFSPFRPSAHLNLSLNRLALFVKLCKVLTVWLLIIRNIWFHKKKKKKNLAQCKRILKEMQSICGWNGDAAFLTTGSQTLSLSVKLNYSGTHGGVGQCLPSVSEPPSVCLRSIRASSRRLYSQTKTTCVVVTLLLRRLICYLEPHRFKLNKQQQQQQ